MSKEKKPNEKDVTITVYEIHFAEQNVEDPNLVKDLFTCLNSSDTARERLMPLTSDENNTDNDFIPAFESSSGFLFGSFARLTEGEESSVPKAVLDKKTISLNEMITVAQNSSEGSIKSSSFFCIYKTLLTSTSGIKTIKYLETYINWLLDKNQIKKGRIVFKVKKNSMTKIPIKEIRSVKINGDYINAKSETKIQSMNLTASLLHGFLDIKGTKTFDEENIVSATLTLKFKQNIIAKENALDAALKIIDDDNIVITGKNGKTIKGSEYKMTFDRKIEKLKNGLFNEQEINSTMRGILKEVINNAKVES